MDWERSEALQQSLIKGALIVTEICGPNTSVADYAQAVRLIGKASGIAIADTENRLSVISKNQDDMHHIESGEQVASPAVKDASDILKGWPHSETFSVLMGLFEAALGLEYYGERRALFNIAKEIDTVQGFSEYLQESAGAVRSAEAPN